VKNIAYRYNLSSAFMSADDLTSLGLASDDFETIDVNNFSANVGVQFYLGGRGGGELTEIDRALQEQMRGGLRGLSLRVEPSGAEVDFAESLGFRDHHRFVGVACGVDLGPLVGLRGFYWRGTMPESWVDFDDIQAYGGELKLAFNDEGGSVIPYLTVGGGFMDVRDGYVGNGLAVPEDQSFAFGGVGVLVPLGSAVGVELGVRSLLMTTDGLDNLSDPNDVEANTMIYGGVSFGLGRRGRTAGPVFGREMAEARSDRERLSSSLSAQESNLQQTAARVDSLSKALSARQRLLEEAMEKAEAEAQARAKSGIATAPAPAETTVVKAPAPKPEKAVEPAPARSDRWVNLPVPEEGELYVRYGGSGGVSVETINGSAVAYLYDPESGTLTPIGAGDEVPKVAVGGEARAKKTTPAETQVVQKPAPQVAQPAPGPWPPATAAQPPVPVAQQPAVKGDRSLGACGRASGNGVAPACGSRRDGCSAANRDRTTPHHRAATQRALRGSGGKKRGCHRR
jgi:hypothetical protein